MYFERNQTKKYYLSSIKNLNYKKHEMFCNSVLSEG